MRLRLFQGVTRWLNDPNIRRVDRLAMHAVTIPLVVVATVRISLIGQAPTTDHDLLLVESGQVMALDKRVDRLEKMQDVIVVGLIGNLIASGLVVKSNRSRRS